MKWLQWSSIDLAGGTGGVEVHARCLARELSALGCTTKLSSDPQDLMDPSWDVIHSHGSASLPEKWILKRPGKRVIRVMTLHGTTLGRMAACREWTWIGGYQAAYRETQAVLKADVVFTVNPELHLFRLAKRLGKKTDVTVSGWDAGVAPAALPPELDAALAKCPQFWVFVGRGKDPVKGADRLIELIHEGSQMHWVAVPGDGFEGAPSVLKTGRLTPAELLTLFDRAQGMLVPSKYEGQGNAMTEALSRGLLVVAAPFASARSNFSALKGFSVARSSDTPGLVNALSMAQSQMGENRDERARFNQSILPTWKKVAERALRAVNSGDY